jgi:hypothetical protein
LSATCSGVFLLRFPDIDFVYRPRPVGCKWPSSTRAKHLQHWLKAPAGPQALTHSPSHRSFWAAQILPMAAAEAGKRRFTTGIIRQFLQCGQGAPSPLLAIEPGPWQCLPCFCPVVESFAAAAAALAMAATSGMLIACQASACHLLIAFFAQSPEPPNAPFNKHGSCCRGRRAAVLALPRALLGAPPTLSLDGISPVPYCCRSPPDARSQRHCETTFEWPYNGAPLPAPPCSPAGIREAQPCSDQSVLEQGCCNSNAATWALIQWAYSAGVGGVR